MRLPPNNTGKVYRKRVSCRAGHPREEGATRCRVCNAACQRRWRALHGRYVKKA